MNSKESVEKKIKDYLKEKLKGKHQFTTIEIRKLMMEINPGIKKTAYAWWINRLHNQGFFTKLGRGVYTFATRKKYNPVLSRKAKQFYNKARTFLPDDVPLLMYESTSIADMLGVEPQKHYIFLHVPREHIEHFFYDILHLGKRVFIRPTKEITKRYILPFYESVILVPYLTDMPIVEIAKTYSTLSIEGILVHSMLFGKEYYMTRDIEIEQVYNFAMDNYNVNVPKLLRYAGRREKRAEIRQIIDKVEERQFQEMLKKENAEV